MESFLTHQHFTFTEIILQIKKGATNIWEYKVDIIAITANFAEAGS